MAFEYKQTLPVAVYCPTRLSEQSDGVQAVKGRQFWIKVYIGYWGPVVL